jgi:Leucine-rich repeat (LRR) protein
VPPLKETASPIAETKNSPITNSPSTKPTPKPVLASTKPTGSPSTAKPITPTPRPTTAVPTLKPTPGPTMPEKYYEMLKAAKFVSGKTAFERTDTAQSLAFHWLYFTGNPSSNLYEFFEQYATAVIFFSLTKMYSTSLLPQDAGNDFTTRREICGWSGVRCAYNYTSETVHVTEIKLPAKKLTGPIPSEIGFLPYLITIDLANNDITGTIPEELYGLERLRHLYLNDNKLQGTISPRIDELNLAESKFNCIKSFVTSN